MKPEFICWLIRQLEAWDWELAVLINFGLYVPAIMCGVFILDINVFLSVLECLNEVTVFLLRVVI